MGASGVQWESSWRESYWVLPSFPRFPYLLFDLVLVRSNRITTYSSGNPIKEAIKVKRFMSLKRARAYLSLVQD